MSLPFSAFVAHYGRYPVTSWDAAWLEGYAQAQVDRPQICVYCRTEHAATAACADGLQRRPPARSTVPLFP